MPEAAPEAAALPPTLPSLAPSRDSWGAWESWCVSGKLYARISSCQFCYCSKFCPLQDTGSRPAWKIAAAAAGGISVLPRSSRLKLRLVLGSCRF